MNLFLINDCSSFPSTTANSLRMETPLGQLRLNCLFNDRSLSDIKPQKSILINSKTILSSWMLEECYIEFLCLDFIPKIPLGMRVDKCIGGIWRIKNFNENVVFKFNCLLDSSYLKSSPESGEGLLCQSFENFSTKLSIGTEDEELLIARAAKGNWLPSHFKDNLQPSNVCYVDRGLEVVFPQCRKNDRIQVHFIATWASKANDELSTWYAVDQSPESMLKKITGFT